jgi:uncharacterized membrane protein YhaH (DUF805 family)
MNNTFRYISQVLTKSYKYIKGTFEGEVSAFTFAITNIFYISAIIIVFLPLIFSDIFERHIQILYFSLAVIVLLIALFGILKTTIQRLHAKNYSGFWLLPILLGFMATSYLVQKIEWFLYEKKKAISLYSVGELNVIFISILAILFLVFLLKNKSNKDSKSERNTITLKLVSKTINFKFIVISVVALLSTSLIYYTFFQDKIWVGGYSQKNEPATYSDNKGRIFLECKNFKGVQAIASNSQEIDAPSGFYKDSISDRYYFSVLDDGSIDIFTEGNFPFSFKAQNFIVSLESGLENVSFDTFDSFSWVENKSAQFFSITAKYSYKDNEALSSSADKNVNYTHFNFIQNNKYEFTKSEFKVILTTSKLVESTFAGNAKSSSSVFIGTCYAQ